MSTTEMTKTLAEIEANIATVVAALKRGDVMDDAELRQVIAESLRRAAAKVEA